MQINQIILFCFPFLFSFLLSLLIIPLVKKIALRWSIVDCPDGLIKKHKNPVPYLGGLGIYFGFLGCLLWYNFWHTYFIFGLTGLILLGLVDDLYTLSPLQKFVGQLFIVILFVSCGFVLPLPIPLYFNIIISIFWMLTIINAFNLVDVMDGLAILLALIATMGFLLCSIYTDSVGTILLLAFGGSATAFFIFNKPPALIYLGDSGSLFVGGFLALAPMFICWPSISSIIALPIVILGLPLLEISSLIIIRTFKGIPFYRPSPDHFYQYLNKKKWSTHQILWGIFFVGLIQIFLAGLYLTNIISLLFLTVIILIFLLIWLMLVF